MSDIDFDTVMHKIPFSHKKANILYNLEKLDSDKDKEEYKSLIVSDFYNRNSDINYLFFPSLYKKEIKEIHEIISYTKHSRVIRIGVKCRFCKGTNTDSKDERKGGGDEYIPSRVICYDCGKRDLV